MVTPTTVRLSEDDKRRVELIKHLGGYLSNAAAIREALRDKLERLQSKRDGE